MFEQFLVSELLFSFGASSIIKKTANDPGLATHLVLKNLQGTSEAKHGNFLGMAIKLKANKYYLNALIIIVSLLIYIFIFTIFHPRFGLISAAFAVIPIAASAWVGGLGAAIVTTLIIWSMNILLFAWVGITDLNAFLAATPGNVVLLLIGAVVGILSDSLRKLRIEVLERKKAQRKLRDLAKTLEAKVIQRTSQLVKSNKQLSESYDRTLLGWAKALELRDRETEGHTKRVTELAVRLAQKMGVSDNQLINIRRGALLHDIGKMGIPDTILLKPGPLSKKERLIMRRHPELAYKMLSSVPFLKPCMNIPLCHHERWDGKGYPRGLKGKRIPLEARIFALADVWDALTNDRPYRKAWSKQKTMGYIQENSGKHFDPQIVEYFRELIGFKN